ESGSGSDALGAKTRAMKQADGSYVISGEKMWITNGGFADVYVIFAKVDGEHFTAFIVERKWAGMSSGKEEHKLGLHGSSTTPVILQDVKVPADAVLGEVGKGHKVAFNVLNFGRFKLGAMSSGGAKKNIEEAAKYSSNRKQFNTPIGQFGAIKHKLAEMAIRIWVAEGMVYRTAGLMDRSLESIDVEDRSQALKAIEEYAIECSILKVFCSEVLDFAVDEAVQIYGGYGYSAEYAVERYYRDSRVNRIFEGTNEINRLLIPGMLVRRGLKGDLPLIAAARKLQDDILAGPGASESRGEDPLDEQHAAVRAFRKVALMSLGLAMQRYGEDLANEQEVLLAIADIVIALACAESALLRASTVRGEMADYHVDAASIFINDAAFRIDASARHVLAAMAEGDTLRTHLAALRRLLKVTPIDTVKRRRRIADETVRRGSYIFQ
ncbi:MAG TPA: acyl-CoA dehydrogenase family protein, partial [Vicinamibacterales bacterium]|nr:acyl-CoA dehydrogenase family protein [Vicinamibacterales bacterium]